MFAGHPIPIFTPVTSHVLTARRRRAGREVVVRVSNLGEWQLRLCPNRACITTALRVRRDLRDHEQWWVGQLDYSGTWRIAGAEPCCPLCGSDLEAGVRSHENAG